MTTAIKSTERASSSKGESCLVDTLNHLSICVVEAANTGCNTYARKHRHSESIIRSRGDRYSSIAKLNASELNGKAVSCAERKLNIMSIVLSPNIESESRTMFVTESHGTASQWLVNWTLD